MLSEQLSLAPATVSRHLQILLGADSYVDGLHISFLVRADEYTKETFGGVLAECGRIDDISSCGP